MGKVIDGIDEALCAFLGAQPMFFVATAPTAFDGPPRIVRLHGRGEAVLLGDPRFDGLAAGFAGHPGARAVVRVDVTRVADSCGFGVPRMTVDDQRDQLTRWAANRGPEGLAAYRAERNALSIDGLPAFTPPVDG